MICNVTLFGEIGSSPTTERAVGPFAGVALEQNVDRVLDYAIPSKLLGLLRTGQRVKVPLGRNNKSAFGYVVSIHETSDYPKIKDLTAIEDERVLVDGPMLELARWISRYYVTPLGTVIESVVPAAVKKKIGIGYSQLVSLNQDRQAIQTTLEATRAAKRRAILGRLLQLEPGISIEINRLAGEAGVSVPTVRKLVRLGLISIRSEPDLSGFAADVPYAVADEPAISLNPDQQCVVDELTPRMRSGGYSVNLLFGVTGSGKTEIYLRCIREVVSQGKQAIVLVPEIALTPQTVRRFTARFSRVAVLHSGLSSTQRHRYWQQISQGQADVIVGARSAIFAPVPKLGVIVVDEEHESSYKQDTAPRYHARDVGIKRAQLQGAPILLGSATPSLETWNHVTRSCAAGEESAAAKANWHLLELPSRVRGLQLPKVELIDMKIEAKMRRGIHLISTRLEHLLRHTIEKKEQAILLLNRRGYSNFVYCRSCSHVMQCNYCDATLTYHRAAASGAQSGSIAQSLHAGQLHCHYCLAVNPLPATCPECGKKLSLFGMGTQRVEEELLRLIPGVRYARVDSDTMRGTRDYEKVLGLFARRELDLLLGTQMIAKGLDFPNVTLVGVISGDTALALPDFRASERTFQLITQVAGRAGRGEVPGRVALQTFIPDQPAIQLAMKQDFPSFAKLEISQRKETQLPPCARMVRLVLRDQDPEKLNTLSSEVAAQLLDAAASHGETVVVRGPAPCAIARIANYHRAEIRLISDNVLRLQNVLARVREKGALARSARIAVDVDPVNLL